MPLFGSANDDSGAKQPNPAGSSGGTPSSPTNTASTPTTGTPGSPGGAGSPGAPSSSQDGTAPANASSPINQTASAPPPTDTTSTPPINTSNPGKRLKNPLGEFASYTYQISLYMITPDAYDAFIASGRTNINAIKSVAPSGGATGANIPNQGGAFLLAQSGGINNTDDVRAEGFNFDYYIDNLTFTTQVMAQGAAIVTDIEFTITEPYGFSFIQNLKRASDAISQYLGSNTANITFAKQFFILGIRFFGYDQQGKLVKPENQFFGSTLDPSSIDGSLFQQYFDIQITGISSKINGKTMTYQCSATGLAPGTAYSQSKGTLPSDHPITATTVGDALTKLKNQLNDEQQKLVKAGSQTYPIVYNFRFAPGAEIIAQSPIVSPADLDKSKWAGSGAKTTSQSNASKETTATPENNSRNINFTSSTTITQGIQQVITQSEYLRKALTVVYASSLQTDQLKNAPPEIVSSRDRPISWYRCTTEISNAKWDPKLNNWITDITYVIHEYDTPVVASSYASSTLKYYGPHKRYEYWYTGENSEVISYEQNIETLYTSTVVSPPDPNNPTGPATPPSGTASPSTTQNAKTPNTQSPLPRTNTQGYAATAQNNYLTSLYDYNSYAEASVTILGDPDFLIQDSDTSINQVYDKYYGSDGFTISANGGQVFIEIDFKEAVDYTNTGQVNGVNSSEGGTLNINNSILFFPYPPPLDKIIHGISLQVREVKSKFDNGKFTQDLSCFLNDFGKVSQDANSAEATGISNSNKPTGSGPAAGNSAVTTSNTGTKTDPAINTTKTQTPTKNSNQTPAQPVTNTGPGGKPVANDHGGG